MVCHCVIIYTALFDVKNSNSHKQINKQTNKITFHTLTVLEERNSIAVVVDVVHWHFIFLMIRFCSTFIHFLTWYSFPFLYTWHCFLFSFSSIHCAVSSFVVFPFHFVVILSRFWTVQTTLFCVFLQNNINATLAYSFVTRFLLKIMYYSVCVGKCTLNSRTRTNRYTLSDSRSGNVHI